MNRRSMLSFLGIGAVGASTLGVQSDMNPVPSTQDSYWIDKKSYVDATPMVKDTSGYIKDMQEQLSLITSDPAKWIADRVTDEMKDWRMGFSAVKFSEIDPDIRNMKSITETAKMRMYFERRATRQAEVNQTSLTHRIAEYLGVKV
jgi:hypothetical protein